MMMSELIFMRDDGDDSIELTNRHDENAVPYVRADCAETLIISQIDKRNFFVEDAEHDPDFHPPCCDCRNRHTNECKYPCAACTHG